jgi:hypothetical protein
LLLQYNVPYSAASKKADLVALFALHIAPQGSVRGIPLVPSMISFRIALFFPWLILQRLLTTASGVRPSASGIINVAEDGTESVASTGQKRGRGRPKKSIAAARETDADSDPDVIQAASDSPEPPVKKPRGRSKRVSQSVEIEVETEAAAPKKRQGRPRKSVKQPEEDLISESDNAPVSRH